MSATLPPITLPPPVVVHHSSGGLWIGPGSQLFTEIAIGPENVVVALNKILGQCPGGFEFVIQSCGLVPVAASPESENGGPQQQRILRAQPAPGGAAVQAPVQRAALAFVIFAIKRPGIVPENVELVPEPTAQPQLAVVEREGGNDAEA